MPNIFENILFALLNWRFFLKFFAFYIKKLVANNFDGEESCVDTNFFSMIYKKIPEKVFF